MFVRIPHRTQTIKDNWKRLGLDNGGMNGAAWGVARSLAGDGMPLGGPRCHQPQLAGKAMANRSSKASQAERVLSRRVAWRHLGFVLAKKHLASG